jgi:hypothetical protein
MRNIKTLCFGIEAKQPKQTEQNRKNLKTINFLKKYQNMLPIKVFRLVFCLFQFNRNIETLCFGIEAKPNKPNKTEKTGKRFVSDSGRRL